VQGDTCSAKSFQRWKGLDRNGGAKGRNAQAHCVAIVRPEGAVALRNYGVSVGPCAEAARQPNSLPPQVYMSCLTLTLVQDARFTELGGNQYRANRREVAIVRLKWNAVAGVFEA